MWNADIYNRYDKERIQPSIDLAARLRDKDFKRIMDVGCGTGMSTASILQVWNDAEILGVDVSDDMLEKAKADMPKVTFLQRDCSQPLLELGTFDLIFSNAFLQWIPGQEEFIRDSFKMLNEGGVFAAQIPLFEEMPANQCILKAESLIQGKSDEINLNKFVLHSAAEYHDMLSGCTSNISIWITEYCHEMEDHNAILEFLKGAALRPYIERLDCDELNHFLDVVLENIEEVYPRQKNGKVLFPFRRLFLIGEKM